MIRRGDPLKINQPLKKGAVTLDVYAADNHSPPCPGRYIVCSSAGMGTAYWDGRLWQPSIYESVICWAEFPDSVDFCSDCLE
jgi:hypothetical protein